MKSKSTLPQKAEGVLAVQRMQELRLLSGACLAASEKTLGGNDLKLLFEAGWTVVAVLGEGLLAAVLNPDDVIDANNRRALDGGTPRLIRMKFPPKVNHYEELLREVRKSRIWDNVSSKRQSVLPKSSQPAETQLKPTGETEFFKPRVKILIASMTKAPQKEDVQVEEEDMASAAGDFAAVRVIARAWEILAPQHRALLPPQAARVFMTETRATRCTGGDEFNFIKAAWVCGFLADSLEQRFAAESPNGITITKASKITAIDKGVLSRAADDGEIKTNGKRFGQRRLEMESLLAFQEKRAERAEQRERSVTARLRNQETREQQSRLLAQPLRNRIK